MRRHRATCKEMIGGGIGGGSGGGGGNSSLHALQVKSVFLQVAGHVFSCQAIHTHELHYGFWDGVFDAQLGDGVDESLVELWGPHEARAFQSARRLFGIEVAGICEFCRVELRGGRYGRRRRRMRDLVERDVSVRVLDVEGDGEIRSD